MESECIFPNIQKANEKANRSQSEKYCIYKMFRIMVPKQRYWRKDKPIREPIICYSQNKANDERENAKHATNTWHISNVDSQFAIIYIIIGRSFSIESILSLFVQK